ncbi:hypothetical protein AAFA46_08555 [Oscillospiraceae bacterium WX1]
MKKLRWLTREESGQGIVEYALLIAGIALALMIAVFALGQQVINFFSGFGDKITHP